MVTNISMRASLKFLLPIDDYMALQDEMVANISDFSRASHLQDLMQRQSVLCFLKKTRGLE
jgi:hypothetical protein